MDDNNPQEGRTFSYPGSDQAIQGVSDKNRNVRTGTPGQTSQDGQEKPLIHVWEALSQEKERPRDLNTIRTYQADIAGAIKNDNVSMVKVALAEKKRQERRGNLDQVIEDEKHDKTYLFIAGAIGLLVLAIGTAAFVYISSRSAPVTTPTAQATTPVLYTENQEVIDVTGRDGDDISRIINRTRGESVDYGSMKALVLTAGTGTSTHEVTTQELFSMMSQEIPDGMYRSLDSNFLLGMYGYSSPDDIFAVFTISDYDTAFATMLTWETTMETDIGGIFISPSKRATVFNRQYTTPATSTDSTSTSSTASTSDSFTFKHDVFVDRVLDNKDTRVLIDSNGNILMLYSFLDKNHLVIASSEQAFREVIFRLTSGEIVR